MAVLGEKHQTVSSGTAKGEYRKVNRRNYPMMSSYGRRRGKHRKALIITLSVIAALLVAAGVFVALNYNTILLGSGRGTVRIKDISQIRQSVDQSGLFGDVQESTDADGNQVIKCVSKDKAVTLTVTQKKDGSKTVNAQVDLKKVEAGGIKADDLKSGGLPAVQAAKSAADKYVGTVVDKSEVTGMETYVAKEAFAQYKSGSDNISVSNRYGNTSLDVSGSLSTKKAEFNLKQ